MPPEGQHARSPDAAGGSLRSLIELAEFRAALRTFLRRSEQVAQRHELTPQRYLLLLMVKGAPDGSERMSFGALADRLKVSVNTVTELVARAEEVGLVGRERSRRDGRVQYVRLTEEGERRLAAVVAEGDGDRVALQRSFARLSASFRALGA